MNIKNLKTLIPLILSLGLILFLFIFLVTCTQIGYGVRENCERAQTAYEGDCTEALIYFLDDEENSFKDRNSAIWALGQLGDERALETLQKYYTGVPDGREPLNEVISQYELSKAIKLVGGGLNLSAWVWR